MVSKKSLRDRMTVLKLIGRMGSIKEIHQALDRLIVACCHIFDGTDIFSFSLPDQKKELSVFLKKRIKQNDELLIDLSPAIICVSVEHGKQVMIYSDGY